MKQNIIDEACKNWECTRDDLTLHDLNQIEQELNRRIRNLKIANAEFFWIETEKRLEQRLSEVNEINQLKHKLQNKVK